MYAARTHDERLGMGKDDKKSDEEILKEISEEVVDADPPPDDLVDRVQNRLNDES